MKIKLILLALLINFIVYGESYRLHKKSKKKNGLTAKKDETENPKNNESKPQESKKQETAENNDEPKPKHEKEQEQLVDNKNKKEEKSQDSKKQEAAENNEITKTQQGNTNKVNDVNDTKDNKEETKKVELNKSSNSTTTNEEQSNINQANKSTSKTSENKESNPPSDKLSKENPKKSDSEIQIQPRFSSRGSQLEINENNLETPIIVKRKITELSREELDQNNLVKDFEQKIMRLIK